MIIRLFASLLLLPSIAFAGEAHIPVSVVITTPLLEMSIEDAYKYCQENDDDYCRYFEDGTLEVTDGDLYTMFEALEQEGVIQ